MGLKVLQVTGEIEDFKPIRIKNKIIAETGLSEDEAERIKNSVVSLIHKRYTEEVDTSTIRSLINNQLVKRGFIEEEDLSKKLGMSVSDITNLIENGNQDNANIMYSPEMVAKYIYDANMKSYALLSLPKELRQAHTEGYIHIHDLEYFNLRPNCFNHDIRFYGKNGLKIDGKGIMGSVANPAKSLKVILNHMLQAMMAGAMVLSGGQSFSHFNVFLATYCKGMSYSEIKQEIQGFIYNCNMSLIGRGGQSIFSSINLEFSIPDFLKDVPAVAPSGVYQGVYGDYEEESELVFKAVCEVLKEKDAIGRYFTFPNTLFVIREHTLDKYDWKVQLVHELLSENPTIYFMNCVNENRITMGALTIDTPVMTNKGLKYPNELKIGDTVMTYNPDGSKSWNKLYNVIEKPAPEKVFKFTCENGYSFKVTENHKLPTKNGIKLSEDIKIGDELYNYVDEKDDYKLLKEYEFIGIFLADGHITHKPRHRVNNNNIEFHFKKDWKIKEVCSICDDLGYNYNVKKCEDETTKIYVKEKELRDKLVQLYDDKRNCKRFPNDVWDNKDKIYSVIIGLSFDSCLRDNHNYYEWDCSDKPLVEDVCFALSYLGYKTGIYKQIKERWRPSYHVKYGEKYKPFKTTIVKSIELVDNTEPVYDLSVENNANYVCGLGGIHSENCRTTLSDDWTGDWEKDLMNTGNFHYTTINLPLLALESENINDFYNKLSYYMDISRLILLERKRNVEHVFDLGMSDFLLQKDKETGEPLYDIKRCSFSIGLCGLNECLKEMTGKSIKEDSIDGEKIVSFMSEKINEYKQKDNLRWSLFFSPAESTAHRFAEINKKKYPKDAIVNGTKGSYYLTNSSHINVDDNATLVEHIKNANIFHKYAKAGNILHLWLGEPFPDSKSLYSLNKKIAETETKFWAYTNDYTYCRNCQHNIQLPLLECPNCGSKNVVVMSRITGYYQPVLGYNKGKKQEFKDRYRHRLNE